MSAPIDTVAPHLCSLGYNQLCGLTYRGEGTYTAEGITKLCEALKGSAVTSLRCAPRVFAFLSAPADTFPNTCPSLLPESEREHIPSFVPFRTHWLSEHIASLSLSNHIPSALARKRTRPFPIPIHTMLPYTVRRVDRGHVLLRDGWVARAPAPISPPCDLPVTA